MASLQPRSLREIKAHWTRQTRIKLPSKDAVIQVERLLTEKGWEHSLFSDGTYAFDADQLKVIKQLGIQYDELKDNPTRIMGED
jgi:hypothetical protein